MPGGRCDSTVTYTLSEQGLDLFKLSAGAEVPNYQAILGPNDVFGLGASL